MSRMASRAASAGSSIRGYQPPESRLSQFSKPEMEDGETRAEYGWRLIRSCIRDAITIVSSADVKEVVVSHGVHHSRRVNNVQPITQMAYNTNTKEYVTLDGKMIRVFMLDGRKKGEYLPDEAINRILFCAPLNLYIGWTHNHHELFLLDTDFNISSMSEAEGPILSLVYNQNLNEVVTIGPGYLTSWVFRYGGRHLLPRKTTHDGLAEQYMFTHLVLEGTASRFQKAYAAFGTSIAMFNLSEGTLLSWQHELHTRTITSLLFFNPLKFLVTGAADGSIKVWDDRWHLQLVFVGHQAAVTNLAIYPYGPMMMSSSKDCSIRIWSLESCDEVDQVYTDEPVDSLVTTLNHDFFGSVSDSSADLWKVEHAHMLHTTIGHKVLHIKSTDHPSYPIRSLLLCADSSVRILCPTTGDVISTLLMPQKKRLIDAAYAIASDFLFAVFANGEIIKSYTGTNPCTVLERWPCNDPMKACNYLLVYEYVITADITNDTWGGMRRAIATKGLATTPSGKSKNADRTLLLGGRKDGHICVFNWDTGGIEFEIEAHGTRGVLSMIANSKADQLISAGLDNIIKVWRLYPYAQESLAPLLSFYCAHLPLYMNVMRDKLAVAFQEHTTATYSVVMYNLQTRNRNDHGPEDDHMDSIRGLTACNKMKLVASASTDGTVRIWNESNVLIRLIKLNAVPNSLCFCSSRGDLLVGIGEHVHRIDYKAYMPRAYRFKMVCMQFPPVQAERMLAFDDSLINELSREDVKRLKAARSSYKYTHFMDVLTHDENEEVMKEKQERREAFSKLEEREMELSQIRDGELTATRKPRSTPATKRAAFNKYLKIFFDRPKVELYKEDPMAVEKAMMPLSPKKAAKDEYIPDPGGQPGFFPSSHAACTKPENPDDAPFPIKAGGLVPNSILIRLLWPQLVKTDDESKEPYMPPQMTAEQLAQIAGLNKKEMYILEHRRPSPDLSEWEVSERYILELIEKYCHPSSSDTTSDEEEGNEADVAVALSPSNTYLQPKFHKPKPKKTVVKKPKLEQQKEATDYREQTLYLDYDDEEEAAKSVSEPPSDYAKTPEPPDMAPSGVSFLSKVQEIMEKTPTPVASPEPEVAPEGSVASSIGKQTPLSPVPPSETRDATPLPQRKPPVKARKPMVKFIARPPPEPISAPKSPALSAPTPVSLPRTPSPPPRPETPLPEFITQFIGQPWFDEYFPDCTPQSYPKPWTMGPFVNSLLKVMHLATYSHKVEIVKGLRTLHTEDGISNSNSVHQSVLTLMCDSVDPPTCLDPNQKAFIEAALQLLQSLGIWDREFYAELLTQFLDADKDIRALVLEMLKSCGLKDSHGYIPRELDGWDVWHLEEKERATELRKMCRNWLDRWLTQFKMHMEDTIDRLKKGQNVVGRVGGRPGKEKEKNKFGILKKPGMASLEEGVEEEDVTQMEGIQFASPNKGSSSASSRLTVTFEGPPDASNIDNATYLEAMNYFCEMEMEKELERMRQSRASSVQFEQRPADAKNTVLVLPKLPGRSALVRLGETHTSKCRPHRETQFCAELKLPPITSRDPRTGLSAFPPSINLPLKTVAMNPFPCPLDDLEFFANQPMLLTLKTSQKYFVPAKSYIPQDIS